MDLTKRADLSQISNQHVLKALEAQQDKNLEAWMACFDDRVVFTRGKETMDFKTFFEEAFDYSERMLKIEKVEDGGLYFSGLYFGGKAGVYRISYRFHENANGKFDRLEMEQTGLIVNHRWHQSAF